MKRFFLIFSVLFSIPAFAQTTGKVVDRVVAVVGNQIVKESDIENGYQQYKEAQVPLTDSLRGAILEDLLYKRLLISEAKRDSIEVTDAEVNGEIDRRMQYYLLQFGSVEAFEKFYGKSVEAFRFELFDKIKELLYAQKMEGEITSGVTISPTDTREYFNGIPVDSIPLINATVEIGQIFVKPPVNIELRDYVKAELEKDRQRIITGKVDFCTIAATSEDPGSKFNCGQYDNIRRGTFVPEFDAVCFRLKEGEISEVFETEYGYHFVKLISRKGEEVSIAHVLRTVPPVPDDLKKCKTKLDSIVRLIKIDTLTFCEAAAKFSDDKDSKYSCGLIINPETGTSRIDAELIPQIDPNPDFPILINQMKVGQISAPQPALTRDGKQAYRVVWLKSRNDAHRANLKDDYQMMQDAALEKKRQEVIDAWVKRKLSEGTYIRIADDYKKYNYKYSWIQATN
jgi:peptidyl-prolyl cis-trans isomerase SurA